MSHGALICRECFRESDTESAFDEPGASAGSKPVCPNCGSDSFSV